MAKHGDELFSKFGNLVLVEKRRLRHRQTFRMQMEGDQFGKQFEHSDRLDR